MAITNGKGWGPCFGQGELVAGNEPLNGDNKCWSNVNFPGYRIGVDKDGNNQLTSLPLSKMASRFTTCELEVWSVMFE